MSKFLQPCLYKNRALEQQWINNIHNSHDLFCGCPDPIEHLKAILKPEQCRHFEDAVTTVTGGTHGDPEPTIDEGDLERLFSEENDVDEG